MERKFKIATNNNIALKAMRPIEGPALESLRKYYRIGLTFSSNALEGNSLTESETKVVIEDGLTIEGKPLRDVYEALGHAKAYDYIFGLLQKPRIEEKDILMLHQLFYQQIDAAQAGSYRKQPVFSSGSQYAVTPPQKIASQMKAFVRWYNSREGKLHPVKLAALTHQRFVFIHPFIDGNGRLARLLMNLALLRSDYTIAIIPAVLRQQYIALLEKAHTDEAPFITLIADCVISTQTDLLRLLAESGGVKNANGGVNDEKSTESGGVKNKLDQVLDLLAKAPGLSAPVIARQLDFSLRSTQRYLKQLSLDEQVFFKGAPKTGGYYLK